MSAEAWRQTGADLAPLPFAWQAWHFRELRLDLRGRRGTFSTCIDVCGGLATNRCWFGAAAFCVAGVALSGTQARFAWQVWYFQHLHRCAAFCVAGVALSGTQARFAWQVWYFQHLHRCLRKLGDEQVLIWRRCLLRGRRGTFGNSGSICVGLRKLGDEQVLIWRRCLLRGRRGTFGNSGSICVAGVVLSAPA